MIRGGELILVENKAALMRKLGRKRLDLELAAPLDRVPEPLARLGSRCRRMPCSSPTRMKPTDGPVSIRALLDDLAGAGVAFSDLTTSQNIAGGYLRRPGERPRS